MQKEEPPPTELHPGTPLSTAGRDRLVELLAIGLERFLTEGHSDPDALTSAADLCLYHRRANDAETDDA